MTFLKERWETIVISLLFILTIFFSLYKLTESPPIWTDEGLIIQTSQNLSEQGIYGFQIAPGNIISPSFISTSYSVTYPIALSFKLFGANLLNARIIMAIYIILLVLAVFLLFKDRIKEKLIWALLLIGSFPPLYGHGKNVLGEVPGLFWVLLSALFLKRIQERKDNLWNWALFGLSFGLALVTKPIFILTLPGFLLVFWMLYREDNSNFLKKFGVLFISSIIPLIIWFFIQFFETDGLGAIVRYYGNPHSVDILQAILTNLKDFISSPRTLFAGGSFLLWTVTIFYSYSKSKKVNIFEVYLYTLSLFTFVLYFRNPPYYRYFFIPETLSLAFLSFNLFELSFGRVWIKNLVRGFLFILIAFQLYQLNFNSWVADSHTSRRTALMNTTIGEIPKEKTIFIYQAPETVIFLRHFNYYQYFSGTVTTQFGEENLKLIKEKSDMLVITRKDLFLKEVDLFLGFRILNEFDRYVLLENGYSLGER